MATVYSRPAAKAIAVGVLVNSALALVLLREGAITVSLIAVLIPIALAMAMRPQRGVLLLAALVAFNGLLIIIPHPSLVNGWKEVLVLSVLVGTFVAPPRARAPRRRRLPGWVPALIGFMVLGSVSAAWVGGLQALQGLKLLYFYSLVAVAILRCPLDARERDRLVTALMVTANLTAAIGLLQQILGPARLVELGYEYNENIRFAGRYLRSISTFNIPFGFGFFLMLALLIALPAAMAEPGRTRNRLFLMSVPMLVAALGSTLVRGAWLGTIVGLFYIGCHRRYRIILLGLPLIALVALYLPGDVISAATSAESSGQRVMAWQSRVDDIVAHPFGVGIGASGAAAEKVWIARHGKGAKPEYFQPDNYYFKVALELGLFGLWLFALLLAAAFRTTAAASRRLAGRDAPLALGVSALVLAIGVTSTAASTLEIFPIDAFFWILLGAVASAAADPLAPTEPLPDQLKSSRDGRARRLDTSKDSVAET